MNNENELNSDVLVASNNVFVGLLYSRGAYEVNNLDIAFLCNTEWGPQFFSKP